MCLAHSFWNLSNGYYDGPNAYVEDGSNLDLTVNGDIYVDGDGLDLYTKYDSTSTVEINGDVTSTDCDGLYFIVTSGSETTASVDGDVAAGYNGIEANVYYDSTLNLEITGDVTTGLTSDEVPALALYVFGDNSEANVEIGGDVSSPVNAIYSYISDSTNFIDLLVEGTISGGEVGITVDSDYSYSSDNFTLTAWQIEVNSDGIVADTRDDYYDAYDPANEAIDFEEKINYIVKYDQPSSGGSISATLADGTALTQYHGYDTANESQRIILSDSKITSGYSILAAYNGTTPLDKDADGNYYLDVPRGGGILLSVDLKAPVKTSPKTGEDGTIYLVGAIVLLAGGSAVLLKTRKKEAEA